MTPSDPGRAPERRERPNAPRPQEPTNINQLGALAQLFANVFINMSWMEVVSPEAAKRYLGEWLTSIPANKVFAFGGDQKSPFLACASAEIVRDNLAEALTAKVARGEISRAHARDLALVPARQCLESLQARAAVG